MAATTSSTFWQLAAKSPFYETFHTTDTNGAIVFKRVNLFTGEETLSKRACSPDLVKIYQWMNKEIACWIFITKPDDLLTNNLARDVSRTLFSCLKNMPDDVFALTKKCLEKEEEESLEGMLFSVYALKVVELIRHDQSFRKLGQSYMPSLMNETRDFLALDKNKRGNICYDLTHEKETLYFDQQIRIPCLTDEFLEKTFSQDNMAKTSSFLFFSCERAQWISTDEVACILGDFKRVEPSMHLFLFARYLAKFLLKKDEEGVFPPVMLLHLNLLHAMKLLEGCPSSDFMNILSDECAVDLDSARMCSATEYILKELWEEHVKEKKEKRRGKASS